MTNVIDFARVRNGREKLALLAQKYPELRGTSSAENVASWIETLQSNGEENVVEYEKTCEYILCRKAFISGRKDARFCCDAHRTAAGKMRDTREPSDISKLMTRAIEFDSQYYGAPSNVEIKRARNTALRDVLSAIETELGIVHEVPVETPMVEPNRTEPSTQDAVGIVHEVPVETPELVREKLRAFMKETSFGQSKIAKLVGVGQPTISQFLSGKTKGSEDFRRAIIDLVNQDHGMDRR